MQNLASWDMKRALAFVRKLERVLSVRGWHVALAGSVLHKGRSKKDIDVVVFPHDASDFDRCELAYGLGLAGMRPWRSASELQTHWRKNGSLDIKHVETRTIRTGKTALRRVDVLVLK